MESLLGVAVVSGNVEIAPIFDDRDGPDGLPETIDDNDWDLTFGNSALVALGGLDGAAELWEFTDDKDGTTRTGDGAIGWSMGAYEQELLAP